MEVRLVPAGGISSAYTVTSDWGSGFQATLQLNNGQATAVANWKLDFDLNASISSIWDGKIVSHSGNHYVISGASYNANLPAGGSAAFGFIASPGKVAAPSNLKVNGVPIGSTPATPTLSVADARTTEGNSGTSDLAFAISLSAPGTSPITVRYATANGTAQAGSDYTAASGTLTFAPGETSKVVHVSVSGDALVEPDETLNLVLSSPSGATLARGQATGTIVNDDVGPQPPPGDVAIQYAVTSDWGTGFNGQVTIKNNATVAQPNWSLAFDFAGTIDSFWSATQISHVGQHYVVSGAAWNGSIAAGASTSFGFGASPGGGTVAPTNFSFSSATSGGGGGGGGENSPPVAVADSAVTSQGQPVTINVLGNDTDLDKDTLSISSFTQPKNGTVVANSDGTLKYTPASAFLGNDAFSYVVGDGRGGTATATVAVTVVAPAPAGAWPNHVFAPYVDTGLYPTYDLAAATRAAGVKYFTLAFITADSKGNPTWGGQSTYGVDGGEFDLAMRSQVNAVRALGGDVMVSFGGANGLELAQTITDVTKLTAAYQKVVDAYGLTHIDLDIEGGAANDHASIDRRSQALAALQQKQLAAGKSLQVELTLPISPIGLTADGLYIVRSALKYGLQLANVNGMAMDYGDADAPNPQGKMGTYAISAATGLHDQLAAIYGTSKTDPQIWGLVGITPMIGLNDITTEVFDQAAANQFTAFAKQHGLGRISMWSLNRDQQNKAGKISYVDLNSSSLLQQPYEFSKIFEGFQS